MYTCDDSPCIGIHTHFLRPIKIEILGMIQIFNAKLVKYERCKNKMIEVLLVDNITNFIREKNLPKIESS